MSESLEARERRVRIRLHYDGEGFSGWQVQPGARTVQSELESALARLTDRPSSVLAAGRTDRGVHATGQVVSARVPARWGADRLERALNAILPSDIWVAAVEETGLDFHARYDAVARGYAYRVGTSATARSPFVRRGCWALLEPLDGAALAGTAAVLPGTHSFRAFAKSGQEERGDRCTVHVAAWSPWTVRAGPGSDEAAGYEFRIVANRFLHHMVRYLVGTMVDAGRGRRPASDLGALLEGEPGLETSPPAPPEGLFLTDIYYDERELGERARSDEAVS